jgi:hypothetical protein
MVIHGQQQQMLAIFRMSYNRRWIYRHHYRQIHSSNHHHYHQRYHLFITFLSYCWVRISTHQIYTCTFVWSIFFNYFFLDLYVFLRLLIGFLLIDSHLISHYFLFIFLLFCLLIIAVNGSILASPERLRPSMIKPNSDGGIDAKKPPHVSVFDCII